MAGIAVGLITGRRELVAASRRRVIGVALVSPSIPPPASSAAACSARSWRWSPFAYGIQL